MLLINNPKWRALIIRISSRKEPVASGPGAKVHNRDVNFHYIFIVSTASSHSTIFCLTGRWLTRYSENAPLSIRLIKQVEFVTLCVSG
jgi:hypothetical protein